MIDDLLSERIEEQIDVALELGTSGNPKEELFAFDRIIRELEELELDSELHYLLGFTYYLYPIKDAHQKKKAIEHLTKALEELVSKHTFYLSTLYLGYCFFDEEDYEMSLVWFQNVDANYFDDFLRLKLLEVTFIASVFACESGSLRILRSFVATAIKMDEVDIFPLSLAKMVENNALKPYINNLDENARSEFKGLLTQLHSVIPWECFNLDKTWD